MVGSGASPAGAVEGSFFNDADYASAGRVHSNSGGVIAAGNREAALAGRKILDAGGNAVDAAAATLFAVGVADYGSCGIGGGGFMVYRSASGVVDTIGFREWSPKTYAFTDSAQIGSTEVGAQKVGHNVVGIPGTVAGMALALKEHGSRKHNGKDRWEDVFQPAISLARNGFTVSKDSAAVSDASKNPHLAAFPTTMAIYGSAPAYYAAGQKMTNLALAADMDELARRGPEAFYDPKIGTIAADLLLEMARPTPYNDQATWEASDLTEYRAIRRPAVRTTYRDAEFIGMGAPSSAGTATAEVLNILEGYDLRAAGQSSADHTHLLAEAMKIAWRDRAAYLADPLFHPTPAFLTSKQYAAGMRAQIDPARAQAFSAVATDEGTNTHNIAVIDKAGNAVAVNCSIEQPMGSAVVAAGTGFLLNNQLTDFDNKIEDGKEHVNYPKPRKRPRSSQAPAIVVRNGAPVLVIGGIGGPSIIGATTSAVLNVVDFGQDVAHAIDAERSDARGLCPDNGEVQLCLEGGRFADDVEQALRDRGHRVKEVFGLGCIGVSSQCEYGAGTTTHAAGLNPATGLREAASDPRPFGSAVGAASSTRHVGANPGDLTGLAAVAQAP